MAEQQTTVDPATDSGEPEAAADDAVDVAEVADVDEASAEEPEAEVTAEEPEAEVTAEEPEAKVTAEEPEAEVTVEEPEAEVTAEEPEAAASDEAGGDDQPARDPEAQAAVDEVTDHATKLGDTGGVVKSPFRTPPGIPSGLDPGTPEERG
jgi:hypothetical protein